MTPNTNRNSSMMKTAASYKAAAPQQIDVKPAALHVHEEIDLLICAADELESAQNILEQRLQPVTNNRPSEKDEAELDPYRVPMASTIRAQRLRIQAVTRRVMDQIERLEL